MRGMAGHCERMDEVRNATGVAILSMLLAAGACPGMVTYHVGNSLTWDSRPEYLAQFAAQRGYAGHDAGWHIRCGSSLVQIHNNPAMVCVDPAPGFGTWDAALGNHAFDAVTFQSHPTASANLTSDTTVLTNMIAQNNDPATRYYILAAWPQEPNFAADWHRPATAAMAHSAAYYDALLTSARDATGRNVLMVPTGYVLAELASRIEAGLVPGLNTLRDIYRDDTHLTRDVGRFVASLTLWAVLYGENPAGLTDPVYDGATTATSYLNQYNAGRTTFSSSAGYTPQLYAALYDVVWDVVRAHPYTGVVPEPGSAALLAVAMVAALRRRAGRRG